MTVIAAVGLPGSGKTEAARVAEESGVTRISMGDVVRQEVERRGLEATDENVAAVSTELRERHGDNAVARLCVDRLDGEGEVFVDGVRGWAEVQYFRSEVDDEIVVLAIESRFSNRYERIVGRNREEDVRTKEELADRDERELEWGMGKALEEADLRVRNDGSLESFRREVRSVLSEILSSSAT